MIISDITVPGHGAVPLTIDEYGAGRPILLLHGGAGPLSVAGFAQLLAAREPVRVLTPTHPGFGGTPRPDWLNSVGRLAELYLALLDALDLTDVTVIGNSIGGWIAAELALLDSRRTGGPSGGGPSGGGSRIGRLVLVDAAGIEVPGEPVPDVFPLSLSQLADLSYHDPDRFRIDESTFTDAQRAGLAANRAALRVYGGDMTDPGLRDRLAGIAVPTLVVWGESDRVVTPAYGRVYADAIPGARFELLVGSGHVPQIETPELLLAAVLTVRSGTAG
jgi:pimeloyl-ACP methyl ester carboxylesterase